MRMYPETKIHMPHSCSQISNNNILVTESTKKKPSESELDTPTIAVAHSKHNLDLPPGLYNDTSSSITLESLATSTNHHSKQKAQSVEHHHNQHMHT